MIRAYKKEDLNRVMELWLNTNIQAHSFISKEFWIGNYEIVKSMIGEAEVYVFEDGTIEGFVGIDDGYIAGIFVSDRMQSRGIGRLLIEACKQRYDRLNLNVYEKNERAVRFYLREGFQVKQKKADNDTSEIEVIMIWEK